MNAALQKAFGAVRAAALELPEDFPWGHSAFKGKKTPPVSLLREGLLESYRAVAPKKLRKTHESGLSEELAGQAAHGGCVRRVEGSGP